LFVARGEARHLIFPRAGFLGVEMDYVRRFLDAVGWRRSDRELATLKAKVDKLGREVLLMQGQVAILANPETRVLNDFSYPIDLASFGNEGVNDA
jgi:hypothetical protein